MDERRLFSAIIILLFCISNCHLYSNSKSIRSQCPRLYEKTFRGYIPRGNLTAGIFEEIEGITKLRNCVLQCCLKDNCNVVFMNDDKCYHVSCNSNELCIPTLTMNPDTSNHVSMVLVKPTDEENWEDILSPPESSKALNREVYNILSNRNRLEDAYNDLLAEGSFNSDTESCEVGIDSTCEMNEVCVSQHPKSRGGICQCKEGYIRNDDGDCFPLLLKDVALHSGPDLLSERVLDATGNKSAPVTRQQLAVVAESKEVRLPESEATLMASVAAGDADDKYQYEWTSLHQPDGSTAVKHQNGGQLHLEKLTEGLYSFKVSVSTPTAYGETFVNVTVLPAKRINQPPNIVITPANQTIKQPNSAAVLDASSSTDDDGIVGWHWELQQGPLGYEPQLKDSPTLQLNDLTKPGNYSFKLTVTDTDKATSTETANITVLAGTDYPPEANAGEDKIIYLPHNSIMLNGNLSIDDHAITTWEWTKSADDAQKAVDMQDTRTPYLQLSNLEEGMYTFTLKVTDSANQSSTAQVHVFVKPPTNKPPVADAGQNLTISLPQTWVVLDGGNSTDDNQIMEFKWEQVEGPSTVSFERANASKTNVTGLTKGVYTFQVSVTDDNKNVASDRVTVTVNQNKNQKPTANAGDDFTVELPRSIVTLNGSNSKDDWAIVRWKWTRDENSLAIGSIAEKTDESPVLILTDVAIGKYIFNLTVYDEQGLSDTDSVTFVVKSDPKFFYLIEITIDIDAKYLTEAQYNTLKGKLALLVKDGSKLQVRSVRPEVATGKATITFYLESPEGQPIPANDVVRHLRQKLKVDATLLGFSVAKLQTAICQNNCSGHGVCDERTRRCECEAFWMHDMFKVYLRQDEDSDCSWSVLYVVLGMMCGAVIFLSVLWGTVYLCCSWCTRRRSATKPTTYKLIEDTEDLPPFRLEEIQPLGQRHGLGYSVRVALEAPRFSDSRNGHKPGRAGFSKLGRRVKI
ncbi:hypothetical protein NQ318_003003 [Aromia moschata]|uniref:Cadherin domain-containing protein n=1 Tax=Aromia moschata TaxID=1265417 RepID=A0AAV8YRQ2_9CUCU|nr:hypothetical protein NQ318_003003 [Aromia moschata]